MSADRPTARAFGLIFCAAFLLHLPLLLQYRTNPFFVLFEAIHDAAYDRHTYGHTTMGYEADIKAMPQAFDYSRSFFDRFYRPENSVLLIVGSIEVIGEYRA